MQRWFSLLERLALNEKEEKYMIDRDTYFKSLECNDTMSIPVYECPKCKGVVRKRLDIVLTTYPPKHRYECEKCDYSEVR